jgi:hypothetical protein
LRRVFEFIRDGAVIYGFGIGAHTLDNVGTARPFRELSA